MSELANIAQQFQGLPMESLIGGPLNAVADANGKMAQSQTKFILEAGFNVSKKNVNKVVWTDKGWTESSIVETVYDPIMITLSLSRPSLDSDGNQLLIEQYDSTTDKYKRVAAPNADFTIKVPLLSVIPINSLGVLSAEINFEMEVKSSFDEKTSHTNKTTAGGTLETEFSAGWFVKTSIKGSASYSAEDSKTRDTHYQKSNSAKYTVNVKAGQLPLPTGITSILDIYAKNIFPVSSVKPVEELDKEAKAKAIAIAKEEEAKKATTTPVK